MNMLNLPKQTIRVCDGSLDLSKPAKGARWTKAATKKAIEKAERAAIEKDAGAANDAPAKRKSIAPRRKFRIMAKAGWLCFYCGAKGGTMRDGKVVALVIDHRVSVADGGDNSDENLVCACEDCNAGKGRKSVRSKA